jgi:hypothetical protein
LAKPGFAKPGFATGFLSAAAVWAGATLLFFTGAFASANDDPQATVARRIANRTDEGCRVNDSKASSSTLQLGWNYKETLSL